MRRMETTTIRQCCVADIEQAPNIGALSVEYAEESAIAGVPFIGVRFDIYKAIEATMKMRIFGAFDGDRLVGFMAFSVTMMPNYGVEIACQHVFFVAKSYRKTGAGLRLLRAAEREAMEMGAHGLLAGAPTGGRLSEVLPEIGYKPVDTIFFRGFK